MIVIVTGPRDWTDKETVYRVLDEELVASLQHYSDRTRWDEFDSLERATFVLRHGVAKGVDSIANDWGKERRVTIERFPALWYGETGNAPYNSNAGPIRNRQMTEALPRANKCCAFWHGRTRRVGNREVSGTLDMMKVALQHFIPLRVQPPLERTTKDLT